MYITLKTTYGMDNEFSCTDPSLGQFGRHVSNRKFQFYQEDEPEIIEVDLAKYSNEEIEDNIRAYGYTLSTTDTNYMNIVEQYGEDADFVTAECIYEFLLPAASPAALRNKLR